MKLDYTDIDNLDIVNNIPDCQCGTKMFYSDKLHKLVCTNPNCIKTRLQSVMSTLRGIDYLTKQKGQPTTLVKHAREDYDRLIAYIKACNIRIGAELITQGKSLEDLGILGQQLGVVIDNVQFEIDELSLIAGSQLLEIFGIKITTLTPNLRASVIEINKQLGIDGTIWLSQILYEEYCIVKQQIMSLMNYLNLIRPATFKRSSAPVTLQLVSADSLFDELQELSSTNDIQQTVEIQTNTENAISAEHVTEEEELLDELLDW